MQKTAFRKRRLFIILISLCFASIALAADKNNVKFQGKVMELDSKKNTMSVNEKTVVWDQQTVFSNEKGAPITADRLKDKTWIYIEGVNDNVRERISARKIYLLPKYIYQKERHLYPFLDED